MEVNRQELSGILADVMSSCGETPHLYFQPPETVKLQYPCVIYQFKTLTSLYADNDPYRFSVSYDVTYITRSPTSSVPAAMAKRHAMAFDRYYVAENLHHYAYTYTTNRKELPND